jgi:hypothetical protein
MHRPSADDGGFRDLLDIAGVDELIALRPLTAAAFRLVRDGQPIDPVEYGMPGRQLEDAARWSADPALVYHQFGAGATIVLQGLQRSWPPLARFCRQLELELTHPIQANVYVTPPSARGLAAHVDKHDVLVLQFHGRKRWRVYKQRDQDDGELPPVMIDTELAPGDVLYIPTGFPHAAETGYDTSGHITIGIASVRWRAVLKVAVLEVLEGADEPLPPAFARDPEGLTAVIAERLAETRRRLDALDPAVIAATVARRFWIARDPVLTGHLPQLLSLDEINDQWVVRRRSTAICVLRVQGDRLFLLLGDRELDMPADLEAPVRRLVSGACVPLSDLREDLDDEGRRVLVRRLIREGLLERSASDRPHPGSDQR